MAEQIADKEAVPAEEITSEEVREEPRHGKDVMLSWTEERVEQLRRLWLEGLSASRIASALAGGVTRNAVIGKVHRLGLSGRVKAPAAAAEARVKPVKPVEAQSRPMPLLRGNVAVATQHQAAMPLRRPPSEDRVVSMVENVTIMDLRETMCRWPVGDPSSSEFRYCGGKAPIGEGPYCKLHSRMAYQPVQDRRQRKTA